MRNIEEDEKGDILMALNRIMLSKVPSGFRYWDQVHVVRYKDAIKQVGEALRKGDKCSLAQLRSALNYINAFYG